MFHPIKPHKQIDIEIPIKLLIKLVLSNRSSSFKLSILIPDQRTQLFHAVSKGSELKSATIEKILTTISKRARYHHRTFSEWHERKRDAKSISNS